MTDSTPASEFPKLLDLALAEAKAGTRDLVERHHLETAPGFRLDPGRGLLTFGDLTFDAQLVGGFDPKAGAWRWAWADPAIPESIGLAAAHARAFGTANGIPELTTGTVPADEAKCWKWTAFAARLLNWPAIYRAPLETGVVLFVAFQPRSNVTVGTITVAAGPVVPS